MKDPQIVQVVVATPALAIEYPAAQADAIVDVY